MPKINDTNDLSKYLQKQSEAIEEYSPGFAKELLQIAETLLSMEAFTIKELKNIPKIVTKSEEKVHKLKSQLEEEKEKAKILKSQITEVKTEGRKVLAEEKSQFKEEMKKKNDSHQETVKSLKERVKETESLHKETIRKLKQEYQESLKKAKEGSRQTSQRKKTKKIVEKIVLQESTISNFHTTVDNFQEESLKLIESFPILQQEAFRKLELLREKNENKFENITTKISFEIAYVQEYGSLQKSHHGEIWRSLGMSYYDVANIVRSILEKHELSKEELLTIAKLLRVSCATAKTPVKIIENIVKETAIRANTKW